MVKSTLHQQLTDLGLERIEYTEKSIYRALDKLIELERLCNRSSGKSLEEANNGSMAQDLVEMKKPGNEMKHMKTNSQLLERNMIPDPIQ